MTQANATILERLSNGFLGLPVLHRKMNLLAFGQQFNDAEILSSNLGKPFRKCHRVLRPGEPCPFMRLPFRAHEIPLIFRVTGNAWLRRRSIRVGPSILREPPPRAHTGVLTDVELGNEYLLFRTG